MQAAENLNFSRKSEVFCVIFKNFARAAYGWWSQFTRVFIKDHSFSTIVLSFNSHCKSLPFYERKTEHKIILKNEWK